MAKRTTGIMVDLETLDTKATAKVIQIGMVAFGSDYTPIDTFLINVDPEMQPERTTRKSTLEFWASQPKEVQKSVLRNPEHPTVVADQVIDWLEKQPGELIMWANHILFDANVLHSFMGMYSPRKVIDDLFKFYNIQDYATLRHVVAGQVGGHGAFKEYCMESYLKESGVDSHLVHNALDDCLFQLHSLKLIMDALT